MDFKRYLLLCIRGLNNVKKYILLCISDWVSKATCYWLSEASSVQNQHAIFIGVPCLWYAALNLKKSWNTSEIFSPAETFEIDRFGTSASCRLLLIISSKWIYILWSELGHLPIFDPNSDYLWESNKRYFYKTVKAT